MSRLMFISMRGFLKLVVDVECDWGRDVCKRIC